MNGRRCYGVSLATRGEKTRVGDVKRVVEAREELRIEIVAVTAKPRLVARVDVGRCFSTREWIFTKFCFVDVIEVFPVITFLFIISAILGFRLIELLLERLKIESGLLLGGFLFLLEV